MRQLFGNPRPAPLEPPLIVAFSSPLFREDSVHDEIRLRDCDARVVRDPIAPAIPEAFAFSSREGFEYFAVCLRTDVFTWHVQPIDSREDARDLAGITTALRRERERSRPARVDVIGLPRALRRRVLCESAPPAGPSEPVILSAIFAGGWLYLGTSRAELALSRWPGGDPEFPAEKISRAEWKLREALEVFGVAVAQGASTLDLGAAPGGFTSVLLERGARVIAVDPAPLDARLDGAEGSTVVRGYAQDLALEAIPELDLITCDAVVRPSEAAQFVTRFAPKLRAGGRAIVTIKLRRERNIANWLWIEEREFGPLLELERVRHLHSNRCEVTALFRRVGDQ